MNSLRIGSEATLNPFRKRESNLVSGRVENRCIFAIVLGICFLFVIFAPGKACDANHLSYGCQQDINTWCWAACIQWLACEYNDCFYAQCQIANWFVCHTPYVPWTDPWYCNRFDQEGKCCGPDWRCNSYMPEVPELYFLMDDFGFGRGALQDAPNSANTALTIYPKACSG